MINAPSFSLTGRVALITGSSKGLGKAMAFALARQGARVAINYANGRDQAEQTLAELHREGLHGDIADGKFRAGPEQTPVAMRRERRAAPSCATWDRSTNSSE